METSPVTTWEGAEAYFTWANSSTPLLLSLVLVLAVVVGVIAQSIRHEAKSFDRAEGR